MSSTEAETLLGVWDPALVEAPEAEAGRLATAVTWVALRRRPKLMRLIAEARQPEVAPFEWEPWRVDCKEFVTATISARTKAAS